MSKTILEKLDSLTGLRMAPAAAVPDALDLIEKALPGSMGSMLIWTSGSGEIAGGFSRLLGIEKGLAAYAEGFANSATEATMAGSTFRRDMRQQVRSRRLADILQMPLHAFYDTSMCRAMLDPWGIRDLARCVVTYDGGPLGGLVVFRGAGAPGFSRAELKTLDRCADLMGRLLQCRASPGVPVVEEPEPGIAGLDSGGRLVEATRTFRLHLAMQNQSEPGQDKANFDFRLPPEVTQAARGLGEHPATLETVGAWGRFRTTIEPYVDSDRIGLTSRRCLSAGLMMFRRTVNHPLSQRQRQAACALAEGDSFQNMAERWQISRSSVITHVNFLYDKLGVDGKAELMNQYVWGRN